MTVNWDKLVGNRYLQSLHPGMLTKNGLVVERFIKPIGYKKGQDKQYESVRYDRQYVINKIIQLVLKPLNIHDRKTFNSLIDECWEQWEKYDAE